MSQDHDETLAAPENDETMLAGASSAPGSYTAGTVIDQYRIETLLGTGGMAQVYQAVDQDLKRTVALKFLHPHLQSNAVIRERFLREGQAVASINHPHVIGIHGIVEHDQHLYMVLEFIDGEDLHQHLQEQGPYSIEEAIDIIEACTQGLDALHQAGIVHRDIKPHNIFITKEKVIKIGDLGLARSDDQEHDLTTSGEILGTPVFMSPEQVKSDKHIDIRSDIHALGATLFNLLTDKPPFDGDTMYTLCDNIVKGERKNIQKFCKQADARLAGLIKTMMAVDPNDRYSNPQELLVAIQRFKKGQDPTPDTTPQKTADTVKTAVQKKTPVATLPLNKILIWGGASFCLLVIIIAIALSGPLWSNDNAALYAGSDGYGSWLELRIAGERIRLRPVPAGEWTIGSPEEEVHRGKNEARYKVQLSKTVWIADRECSAQLWQQLHPNLHSDVYAGDYAMTGVSYNDIQTLLEQLNARINGLGVLRLPTEAEWEVACRAHADSAYTFGNSNEQLADYGNFADADSGLEWADTAHTDGHKTIAPVASFRPNNWGFYDMHGNVWEWCADAYSSRPGGLISGKTRVDPLTTRGSTYVIRGGSWQEASEYCRSASRRGISPETRDQATGFRLALSLSDANHRLLFENEAD